MHKKFKPTKNMEFSFSFTPDECYKALTGTCSLDKEFNSNSSKKIAKYKADESYCQRLYLAMLKKEDLPLDISIDKAIKCGHYDFSNGRHRTCIAQRKDLAIIAEILYNQNDYCCECKNKEPQQ